MNENKNKNKDKNSGWQISFSPILRYSAVFCLMTLVIMLLGAAVLSVGRMKSDARASLASVHAQTSQRVNESITLLESLASLPEFYDPEVPPIEKVKKLDQMSPYFGYLMICYVDSDITVYSDGSEPASLASRDYMQKLFSTGKRQVTDSFAAGADGVTLNYTVAVPLVESRGNITGCLFCAIYFDEVMDILEKSAGINGSDATLIGSQGQIMTSTAGLSYGDPIMNTLRSSTLFGTTADKLQEQFLAAIPGEYWSIRNGDLYYTVYQRVENTSWDIMCSVNFGTVFSKIIPSLVLVSGLTVLLCFGLMYLLKRYIAKQMEIVDVLVHSVEELEKKIYQDERPEDLDFNEIIRLTSNGLSDSLTGVVTRSVFLNQAEAQMKKIDPNLVSALCFVDMDNLKYINDTYGHSGGDVALKSVGYILREYEKRYDGVIGRYGGDEFVMLLTGLDDENELQGVMNELVLRLHSEVGSGGQNIPVQCSVGVSLYRPGVELNQLIAEADEALYFVKQNGKGYYKIQKN
ncbi:sensor domain-containing diguanylate cyclase [Clostridium sp. AM58-1XD]|uniref:sensor domain-containing diguanylate cyclase n=1 Tax=Clostridium sp. AM58-1XD TaxID=2292307 RepID=UPI000E554783|nr:sensor domain-containing diguanylate cyclase [Clostridium sp. AM58-1XD]RGZ01844.1 GGDEF domain-containing protein [Clostridium sp. AM58-1XD]